MTPSHSSQARDFRDAFMAAYQQAGASLRGCSGPNLYRLSRTMRGSFSSLQDPTQARRSLQQYVAAVVKSQSFSLLCGSLIVGNAFLVGVETEYLTRNSNSHSNFLIAQTVLNFWYIVELMLRMIADGMSFFYSPGEWRWNMLDAFLVSTSVVEMLTEALNISGIKMGRILRSIRLCRMLRTLRILRSLRAIRTFRKMIYALTTSMQTLFWSLLLLFFIMYTFAIWFTSGVSDCLQNRLEFCQVPGDTSQVLSEHYGTLARSIYTLYLSISTGYNWGIFVAPLIDIDPFLAALFLAFISLCFFGVLNIVTSVFVESAMLSTQHYRELMVEEKMRSKEMYARHMRDIFRQIDMDNSGFISLQELQKFVADDGLQLIMYFEALELNASDAGTLFKLLDWDNSGTIDIDEFCDGCMRLKGEARSFDINCLMHDMRKVAHSLDHFMIRTDKLLKQLAVRVDSLVSRTDVPFSNNAPGADKSDCFVHGQEEAAASKFGAHRWEGKDIFVV